MKLNSVNTTVGAGLPSPYTIDEDEIMKFVVFTTILGLIFSLGDMTS